MNPTSAKDAEKLAKNITTRMPKMKKVMAVVAPPFIHLSSVAKVIGKAATLGVQNISAKSEGPRTGEIAAAMLASYKVKYAIIGHSERRALGETNDDVNQKLRELVKVKITPVVCVGESARDHHGEQFSFVEGQVRAALKGVTRAESANIVIAYEPIWAISSGDGKGVTATPEHAHEMKLFIKKVLVGIYGRAAAMRVPIIYGGSVNAANAQSLMKEGEVDGFLIGGASLDAVSFITICKIAETL